MALTLKPLLEGETLSSNLSRYAVEVGLQTFYPIFRLIFGKSCSLSDKILPRGVGLLCEAAKDYWRIAPIDCLRCHTPFNYYLLFAEKHVRDAEAERMLAPPGTVRRALKANQLRREEKSGVRYCDECVSACRQAGVEPYFQVIHQLPGVYVCPEHALPLRVSPLADDFDLSTKPVTCAALASPNDAPVMNGVAALELQAIRDVARRSAHGQLTGGEMFKGFPYHEVLKQAGFVSKAGHIKKLALASGCVEYFGEAYCSKTGLDFDYLETAFWGTGQIEKGCPFKYLAVQSFLAYRISQPGIFVPSIGVAGQRRSQGAVDEPPLRSRSHAKEVTYAEEPERIAALIPCAGAFHHRHDEYEQMKRSADGVKILLTCSCGMSTSCQTYENGETKVEIVRYGERYRRAFRELISSGISATAAVRQLGMNPRMGWMWKNLRPTREDSERVSVLERDSLRASWRASLSAAPAGSKLKSAIGANGRVYRTLQMHDNVWLQQLNRRYDWRYSKRASLAPSYVVQLDAACAVLDASPQPVWKNRKAILAAAGLTRFRVKHAPGCQQHLDRIVERRSDYVDRLLEFWLQRLSDRQPLSLPKLLRHCGLQHKSLTEMQRRNVERRLSSSAQSRSPAWRG